MKILTIRLDEQDEERIEAIKCKEALHTTNGAIKIALKQNLAYANLLSDLSTCFTLEYKVDQKRLKALNHKYGFLQTNFSF